MKRNIILMLTWLAGMLAGPLKNEMVKGIKASFVLGTNERNQTIISARSLGELNVQQIMEKFGGGGHFTSAAAQVEDPLEIVEEQLRKAVKTSVEKENEE